MLTPGAKSVNTPILQFGTGRFLQAHVGLFIAQALDKGQALGKVAVVQSTDSPQSTARAAALADGYQVELRGMLQGQRVEASVHANAIQTVWHARRDWAQVVQSTVHSVQVIISNTADNGFQLDARDSAAVLHTPDTAPHSYPAKLVALLYQRWKQNPQAALSIYPCELVSRNGDVLRTMVSDLAARWQAPSEFVHYIHTHCVWANSLVDRIVSSPLEPAGAVAEPYALWAIESHPRLILPCTHEAVVVTDRLADYEQRKLWLLNLGHTVLAEQWLQQPENATLTVVQAMQMSSFRDVLECVWCDEVLPVFDAEGTGPQAREYLESVRDRFLNPFLEHRLADIAKDHELKKQRRLVPVLERAQSLGLALAQTQLRKILQI